MSHLKTASKLLIVLVLMLNVGCREAAQARTLTDVDSTKPASNRIESSSSRQTPLPASTATFVPSTQPTTPPDPSTATTEVPSSPAASDSKPVIHAFTASPARVIPGEPVVLAWAVSAQSAALRRVDDKGQFWDPDWTPVPPSGSLTIATTSDEPMFYLLRATSGPQTTDASVQVMFVCREAWFFANSSEYCPTMPPTYTKIVVQHFERGLMTWSEWNNQILILYGNDSGTLVVMTNTWESGMPASDPAIVPPSGYYQPVRGFGKLWRENPAVRECLGWATEAEVTISQAAEQNAFFGDPKGTVYLKVESNAWRVWK